MSAGPRPYVSAVLGDAFFAGVGDSERVWSAPRRPIGALLANLSLQVTPDVLRRVGPLVPVRILDQLRASGSPAYPRLRRLVRIDLPGSPRARRPPSPPALDFGAIPDTFERRFVHRGYCPSPESGHVDQRYLKAAPAGVGWHAVDLPPAAATLVDIEYAWSDQEFDLPESELIFGADPNAVAAVYPKEPSHGTKVIGVLSMLADPIHPGVGIAARHQLLRSSTVENVDWVRNIAAAVGAALTRTREGDVLVLQVQERDAETGKMVPAELVGTTWEAFKAATEHGVLVVVAAGNGNLDLDALLAKHAPNGFPDSGALWVAGGMWNAETRAWCRFEAPSPKQSSNFGSRVGCFAQAANVLTVDPHDPGYTPSFSGTSAATAIVAGVAAVVSSECSQRDLPRTPAALRSLLTHGDRHPDGIGVMPNLPEIFTRL